MADPVNPLDVFATYTVHFELHAAASWDDLAALADSDMNASTTREAANGTLLINTRKDAHQTIDDVKFMYADGGTSPNGALVAGGAVSMSIIEPAGMFFVQKVKDRAAELNLSNLTPGMQFGLKIFFVGRTTDNEVTTVPAPFIIPLALQSIGGNFTYKGADYQLLFALTSHSGAVGGMVMSSSSVVAQNAGYVNKNITIKASSVAEALSQLESKLNQNYEYTYTNELENPGSRKLKYSINNIGGWSGKLNLITTETYAPDEPIKLTFHPSEDIAAMVRKILTSSTECNQLIGSSLAGLKQEMHPGVQLPVIEPRFHLKDGEAELAMDIHKYEGGGPVYTFDFLFAEPAGKNVDILDFDIKFPNLYGWMNSLSEYGAEMHSDATSRVAADLSAWYAANVVHPDITRPILEQIPINKYTIPAQSGDIAFLNATPRLERSGMFRVPHDTTKDTRLAFETLGAFQSATEPQLAFTIRGHLDLLNSCVAYPDGSRQAFGVKDGLWAKVNIRDQNGNQFFYTGNYRVNFIENEFSGGRFLQRLTVSMIK